MVSVGADVDEISHQWFSRVLELDEALIDHQSFGEVLSGLGVEFVADEAANEGQRVGLLSAAADDNEGSH